MIFKNGFILQNAKRFSLCVLLLGGILPAIVVLHSCKNDVVTGEQLMPEMKKTDSVQVLYFTSPNQVRFFTYFPSSDKVMINALVKNVSGEVGEENNCEKEGKIYFFRKGEVFNTVFFAYATKGCRVLRFIKNGNLYAFEMNEEVRVMLDSLRTHSINPVSR